MAKVTINGQNIEVEQGAMIIEATDAAGISIPRFCYHRKLPIAANCRMCLVDVEKAPKPLPACATPVTDGMVVKTQSKKAIDAQKSVMEFLLINHPLDCPICDQGGECELQDVAMGYGGDISKYTEGKRSVKDKNIGPLISTDMTRCIHCTRCVRFGEYIAGMKELGATSRGEHMQIGTFVESSVSSELSGNMIDLCPVGALNSKPYRNRGRSWDLRQHLCISPHDAVGSNLYIHTLNGKVVRVAPAENEAVNEVWISDRDRFSYEALYHPDRVGKPLVRKDGVLQPVGWLEAFKLVASNLKNVVEERGPLAIGALASYSNTTEEYYLLQKLMRAFGSNNIDHRLREVDTSDQQHAPLCPKSSATLSDIEHTNVALFIGSDIILEQPIVGIRIRKAIKNNNAQVFMINPAVFQTNFEVQANLLTEGANYIPHLAAILKALLTYEQAADASLSKLLHEVNVLPEHSNIAKSLKTQKQSFVMLGQLALTHPDSAKIRFLASQIAKLTNAKFAQLGFGANSTGAWITGAVPHRTTGGKPVESKSQGKSVDDMLKHLLSGYIWFNVDPEYDLAHSSAAIKAMKNANFNLCITPYLSAAIKQYADIVLPMTPFTETSGTFVNFEGRWQSFQGAALPFEEARPAWKILRVLANMLDFEGFEYTSSEEVLNEIKSHINADIHFDGEMGSWEMPNSLATTLDVAPIRVPVLNIYNSDNIVRRANSLAKAPLATGQAALQINPETAQKLNLIGNKTAVFKQNNKLATFKLKLNPQVALNTVVLQSGLEETIEFDATFSNIELQRG